MKPKLTLPLIVILLTCLAVAASGQKPDPILDAIAQTPPQIDSGWTYAITSVSQRPDGARQASIKWSKESQDRGTTVIVYPTLKSAQKAFRQSGKEDLQDEFRIDGVGDEAFLWPPKTPQGGAYNLRFRKAQVEIWMSGATEEEVKAHAVRIAAAISTVSTGGAN